LETFEQALANVREALTILNDTEHCIGLCVILRSDIASHHWEERAPVVNGVCTKCIKELRKGIKEPK
jgi:hypothetical protein